MSAEKEKRSGAVTLFFMTKGTLLHAPEINFLAALGIHKVTVFKKVKVGFFSTGDELQSIDQPLAPGKIYDSNRYCIGAMLEKALTSSITVLSKTILKP